MKTDTIANNVAATPPVTVAGMTALGIPLADWVQVLAAIWLVVQIAGYLYNFWKKRKQ